MPLRSFYRLLALDFVKHRHGNGLEHFACDLGTVVFEIYPRTSEADSTTATRLGFRVASVDAAIGELEKPGVPVISPPKNSPWGWHAVVTDPDGHKVELTELKQFCCVKGNQYQWRGKWRVIIELMIGKFFLNGGWVS